MKKIMSLLMTVMLSAALLTACTATPTEDSGKTPETPAKIIKMGTNAEFPPFEFINDKGEVDGFDPAIVGEITKTLGYELKIENMEFKSLIGAMETKQIDMIAAGMTVTDERKQSVDFSDPYYTATIQIVVKKDNTSIKSGDDLAGKKVAVQEGTTSDLICTDEVEDGQEPRFAKKIEVLRFKKSVDAIMELKNGKCDAVVLDSNPAKEFVSRNPELVILENDLGTEDYAFAFPKGSTELVSDVNKTLADLKSNGKYDELVKKYID